jgi:NAD(P)H dehydrogenase (quinone)
VKFVQKKDMKKILVINGHPDSQSLNSSIVKAYIDGAKKSGATIKEIVISELDFDPNLSTGHKAAQSWEPDLVQAWDKIDWADHMVWVHPVWWGGVPAKMKGFIDRVFLPGKAFKYRENSIWWDKLLKGKSALLLTTSDQPYWYYRVINKRPSVNSFKRMTLQFSGVNPVKVKMFSPVRSLDSQGIKKVLEKSFQLGLRLK